MADGITTPPEVTPRLYRELAVHRGHDVALIPSYQDGTGVSVECTECGEIIHLLDAPAR
ncbi:hypothetical protein [Tessaracoccus sp.]